MRKAESNSNDSRLGVHFNRGPLSSRRRSPRVSRARLPAAAPPATAGGTSRAPARVGRTPSRVRWARDPRARGRRRSLVARLHAARRTRSPAAAPASCPRPRRPGSPSPGASAARSSRASPATAVGFPSKGPRSPRTPPSPPRPPLRTLSRAPPRRRFTPRPRGRRRRLRRRVGLVRETLARLLLIFLLLPSPGLPHPPGRAP